MAKIMSLEGSAGLASATQCKCVFNKRTKRRVKLCRVPKTKSRSGWAFVKGGC
jgi:hypothetical protein